MDSNLICSVVFTILICMIIYKMISKRTIQVEKFTNNSVVYQSDGKTIVE